MKALQVIGGTFALVLALSSAALAEYQVPPTGTPTNDGGSGTRTSVEYILAEYQVPPTGTPTNDGGSGTRT